MEQPGIGWVQHHRNREDFKLHAIPNHTNSNFQIIHYLVGSCHTPDGGYALLRNLEEGREMALAQLRSAGLKQQAKEIRARRLLASEDEAERLDGQAEIAELEDNAKFSQRNIDAAEKELAFIKNCIVRIQPHRKYAALPDDDAHQAAQRDEWKLELIRRAENSLITSGFIPADHFDTMRMHPDFYSEIQPAISNITNFLALPNGVKKIFEQIENDKNKKQLINILEDISGVAGTIRA